MNNSNNRTPSSGFGDEEGPQAATEFQNQIRGAEGYRGPSNTNRSRVFSIAGGPYVAQSPNTAPSWLSNPRPVVRSGRRSPSHLRRETSSNSLPRGCPSLSHETSAPRAPPPQMTRNIPPGSWNFPPRNSSTPPPTLSELRALNLSSTPKRTYRGFPASLDIVSTKLVLGTGPTSEEVVTSPTAIRFQVPVPPESPTPKPRSNRNSSNSNNNNNNNTFPRRPNIEPADESKNLDTWNEILNEHSKEPPSLTATPPGSTSSGSLDSRDVVIPNVVITGPSPPKDAVPAIPTRSRSRLRAASEPCVSPTGGGEGLDVQALEEGTPTRQHHTGVNNRMHSGLRNVTDVPVTPYSSPSASGSVLEMTIREEPEEESPKKGNGRGKMKTEGDVQGKDKVVDVTKRVENSLSNPLKVTKPNAARVNGVNTPVRAIKAKMPEKEQTRDANSRVFYYQSTNSPPEAIKEQYRRFEQQRNISLAMGGGGGVAKVDVTKEEVKQGIKHGDKGQNSEDEDKPLKRLVDAQFPESTRAEKEKMTKAMKLALETHKEGTNKKKENEPLATGTGGFASGWTVSRPSWATGEMATRPFSPSKTSSRPTSPVKQGRNTNAFTASGRPTSSVKRSRNASPFTASSSRPPSAIKQHHFPSQNRSITPFSPPSPTKQKLPALRSITPSRLPSNYSQPPSRNTTPLGQPPSRAIKLLSPFAPPFAPGTRGPPPATPTTERIISFAHPRPGDTLERNKRAEEMQKEESRKKGKRIVSEGNASGWSGWSNGGGGGSREKDEHKDKGSDGGWSGSEGE